MLLRKFKLSKVDLNSTESPTRSSRSTTPTPKIKSKNILQEYAEQKRRDVSINQRILFYQKHASELHFSHLYSTEQGDESEDYLHNAGNGESKPWAKCSLGGRSSSKMSIKDKLCRTPTLRFERMNTIKTEKIIPIIQNDYVESSRIDEKDLKEFKNEKNEVRQSMQSKTSSKKSFLKNYKSFVDVHQALDKIDNHFKTLYDHDKYTEIMKRNESNTQFKKNLLNHCKSKTEYFNKISIKASQFNKTLKEFNCNESKEDLMMKTKDVKKFMSNIYLPQKNLKKEQIDKSDMVKEFIRFRRKNGLKNIMKNNIASKLENIRKEKESKYETILKEIKHTSIQNKIGIVHNYTSSKNYNRNNREDYFMNLFKAKYNKAIDRG